MSQFTLDRRSLLKGGGGLLAVAATMSSEQLLGYAKAWAQSAPWKPEAGARINLLRWKRFVEAEDVAFNKIVDVFQKATGVTINVSNESYEDVQPKASGPNRARPTASSTASGPASRLPRPALCPITASPRWKRRATRSSRRILPALPI